MRFVLQYILVFAVVKNVLSVIPGSENIGNIITAELPGTQNITKTTIVQIPELQNTINTTANQVTGLDTTNVTIIEIPDVLNTLNNAATQVVDELQIANVTVVQIAEEQNTTNVTATQVPERNVTNVTVNQIPEKQNTINITVPGLNITNATVVQTPKEQITINITATQELGLNTNVTVAQILTVTQVPASLNTTNFIVPQVPGMYEISNKTVKGRFVRSELIPDVIPVAPEHLIYIIFPGGENVSLGNKLTPTQVKHIPEVSWNANPTNYYTLIVVDPDVPSRKKPIYRSILHWCVVNIPGSDVTSGETLAEYIGAGPPEKSGLHRLTFLVYEQPGIILFDDEIRLNNASSYGRNGFLPAEFALKYNLGDPVAGNFYHTSFDHYVPKLYKMLGLSHANPIAPEKIVIAAVVLVLFWNKNVF